MDVISTTRLWSASSNRRATAPVIVALNINIPLPEDELSIKESNIRFPHTSGSVDEITDTFGLIFFPLISNISGIKETAFSPLPSCSVILIEMLKT